MPTRDMRAAGPFRNGVERAIASLARARAVRDAGVRVLADDMTKKDPCLGAEWWIQDVARDEPPKTFHTDCDLVMRGGATATARGEDTEDAERSTDVVHPAVASVLYVSDAGGPTAVFGQRKAITKKKKKRSPKKRRRGDDDGVDPAVPLGGGGRVSSPEHAAAVRGGQVPRGDAPAFRAFVRVC